MYKDKMLNDLEAHIIKESAKLNNHYKDVVKVRYNQNLAVLECIYLMNDELFKFEFIIKRFGDNNIKSYDKYNFMKEIKESIESYLSEMHVKHVRRYLKAICEIDTPAPIKID